MGRIASLSDVRKLKQLAWCVCAAALAAVASPATSAAPDGEASRNGGVNLAPNLVATHGATYEMTVSTQQKLAVLRQSEDTGATMEARLRVEIVEPAKRAAEDGAVATLTFERVMVAFEGGRALSGSFDSDQPAAQDAEDDPLANAIRPMVDEELRLTLDADGTIAAVEGLERMRPTEGMAAFVFQSLFDEQALASMVQPIFRVRPAGEDEVMEADASGRLVLAQAVGSSWPVRTEPLRSLGAPAAELTLTLKSTERSSAGDRLATIEISGETDADVPERVRALDPETTERLVDGEAAWNVSDGLLQSLTTTSRTLMKSEGRFEIEIAIDASSRLRRVK